MANSSVSKQSNCFPNKTFKLSLPRHRSKAPLTSSAPSTHDSGSGIGSSSRSSYELHDVFRYFDSNGDGKISAVELRSFFASLGDDMSYEEVEKVIIDLDTDGDNLLDYRDFVRLMDKQEGRGEADDLKRAFEMFEVEKGCGCITPNGLQRMLNRLGDVKSYDECVAMIQAFDLDGNGVLDFNEFHRMMT